VLEEHLEPLGVPVLYKLPLGHGKHLATLPLGVTATLDADARTLTIDEPALREGGRDPAQADAAGATGSE
jgi:muramoyltetrapeptide carboxypeptidase